MSFQRIEPERAYAAIRNHVAFYPQQMDACYVDGERVQPQPGGFYNVPSCSTRTRRELDFDGPVCAPHPGCRPVLCVL